MIFFQKPLRPPASLEHEIDKWSIYEAANGTTKRLSGGVPAQTTIVAEHEAAIGVAAVVLISTQEKSDAPNRSETTIEIAITTRESGKAEIVSSSVCCP